MTTRDLYRTITSIFILTVMLWNIMGWLGFGLFMNHTHSHNAVEHCDVIFCTCEVEMAGDICTCHHKEMQASDKHSDTTHHSEVCYFSLPHNSNTSTTQGLIVLTKFNALYVDIKPLNLPAEQELFFPIQSVNIQPGVISDLLRPPRI